MFDSLFEEDKSIKKSNQPYSLLNLSSKEDNCASKLDKPELSKKKFGGLVNQGGTCYMNAAIQVLYMNPLFRKIVLELKLFNEDNSINELIFSGHKHEILTAIQDLFYKLLLSSRLLNTTNELTKAFHWDVNEGNYQQDSQEFIRLFLFETLENVFYRTEYELLLKNLFEIQIETCIKCEKCGVEKRKLETTFDIILPIKGLSNITQSLSRLFSKSSFEIISDYFCEKCELKVNIRKGSVLSKLPTFLFFNLNRIEFDYDTFERKKVNSEFGFSLELDMTQYLNSASYLEEVCDYELYAVVIHKGTPQSGHYYAYIRDLTQDDDLDNYTDEHNYKEDIYDSIEYPYDYKNKNLSKNWYCFDDLSINPIKVGRLQKQFKSSESAYMLFYIKKGTVIEKVNLQNSKKNEIETENKKIMEYRNFYEQEYGSILVNVYNEDLFYVKDGILYKNKGDGKRTKIKKEDEIREIEYLKDNTCSNLIIFLLFTYKDKTREEDDDVILVSIFKINVTNTSKSLVKDYFIHEGNYIHMNESSCLYITLLNKIGLLNEIDIKNNKENNYLEAIQVKINYNGKENLHKIYSLLKYPDFKSFILNHYSLDNQEYDLVLRKPIGKSKKSMDFKELSLNSIAFDEKLQKYSLLKNLKLENKVIYLIKKDKSEEQSSMQINNSTVTINDDVHIKLKFDDSFFPDNNIENIHEYELYIHSSNTFSDLYLEINKIFRNEIKSNPFRIRKEHDNLIIYKENLNSHLLSDSVFRLFKNEGVKVTIEHGETYCVGYVNINIIYDIDNSPSQTSKLIKLISPYESQTLQGLKQVLMKELNLKIDEYRFYRTNWLKEPVKEMKNEEKTLKQLDIDDNNTLYIKNIENMKKVHKTTKKIMLKFYIRDDILYLFDKNKFISSETVSIHSKDEEMYKIYDIYKTYDYIFNPIRNSEFRFYIEFSVNDRLKEIYNQLNDYIKSEYKSETNNHHIRIRLLTEKKEESTIITKSQVNTLIKKLNLHSSSIDVLIESTIGKGEEVKLTEIEIFLFERLVNKRKYINKQKIILDYTKIVSYKDLYSQLDLVINKHSDFRKNFFLVKYFKWLHMWERVDCQIENLKKSGFHLRDGDFLSFVCTDNNCDYAIDDLQTDEDLELIRLLKRNTVLNPSIYVKVEKNKGKEKEKGIVIKLD